MGEAEIHALRGVDLEIAPASATWTPRSQARPRRDRAHHAELGTTAMVITHNAAISQIADRVLRLADGRIAGISGWRYSSPTTAAPPGARSRPRAALPPRRSSAGLKPGERVVIYPPDGLRDSARIAEKR